MSGFSDHVQMGKRAWVVVPGSMLLALVWAGACSSSSSSGDGGPDSAGPDSAFDTAATGADTSSSADQALTPDMAPTQGNDGSMLCTSITNNGPGVSEIRVLQPTPTRGTGGTLLDGTYHLSGRELYAGSGMAGATGNVVSRTLQITGAANRFATFETVTSENGGPDVAETFYVGPLGGLTLNWTRTCPVAPVVQTQYSVTTTGFTVIDTMNGRVDRYRKQ